MSETLTWRYERIDQARNVEDELRAAGVPAENVFVDEESRTMKVRMPEATQAGVVELLLRHGLEKVR